MSIGRQRFFTLVLSFVPIALLVHILLTYAEITSPSPLSQAGARFGASIAQQWSGPDETSVGKVKPWRTAGNLNEVRLVCTYISTSEMLIGRQL